MDATMYEKHFLDTSVVRPIILGSERYRQYYKEHFGNDRLYISKFIQMEFKRGYICKILDFYFTLHAPDIEKVGDAFKLWSNRFQARDIKAVLHLVGDLLNDHRYDINDPKDKAKALRAIGQYVKRLEIKLRKKFKDNGVYRTRCYRAAISFKASHQTDFTDTFRRFLSAFRDMKTCRQKCSVHHFIFDRYKSQIEDYVERAQRLSRPKKPENKGFIRITEKLNEILQRGSDACSCRACEIIGDAIIALEALREMRLECTDHAFDHLCPPVGQPHYKHPPELNFYPKSLS